MIALPLFFFRRRRRLLLLLITETMSSSLLATILDNNQAAACTNIRVHRGIDRLQHRPIGTNVGDAIEQIAPNGIPPVVIAGPERVPFVRIRAVI